MSLWSRVCTVRKPQGESQVARVRDVDRVSTVVGRAAWEGFSLGRSRRCQLT